MSPNVHRRMLFYLSNLTMFAIFTSLLTGFNLIQFEKSDQLTRIGVPRPRQTEAEWCSAVLLGHADSDSSTVEDLFALMPPDFEQKFKNPCFYDACHQTNNGTKRKLRCLPFFHVLGVDKCGSTDLYYRIVRHPQISPNNGVLQKETSWWSWRRYGKQLLTQIASPSISNN